LGNIIQEEILSQIEDLAMHAPDPTVRRKAQILLLYDQDLPTREVAGRVGLSEGRTRYWRRRFQQTGMAMFTLKEKSPVEINQPAGSEQSQSEVVPLEDPAEETRPEETAVSPVPPQEIASFADLERHYPAGLQRAEHLRDLALDLFDRSRSVHNLPESHRRLLETAILLQHLAELQKEEGSRSDYLFILSHPQTNLNEEESSIVELALRYQQAKTRRLLADSNHRPTNEHSALCLAALVRLAGGLDNSHTQSTTIQSLESSPDRLVIRVSGPHAADDARAAEKKASLWSGLFGQVVHVHVYHHLLETSAELGLEELMLRQSPGIGPDDMFSEAGRKVMGFNFAAMLRHEDGTRSGLDIEELHDMRVATRRMRAAFEVFDGAFEPQIIRKHLRGLRATGRALGRVRDLDVFMEKAERYLQTLPVDQHAGLAPLLDSWKMEREKDRTAMLDHLDGKDYARFKEKYLVFLTTPGAGARQPSGDLPYPRRVRHIVPELVYSRLAAVRSFEAVLGNASLEQMHALRIEFKKLRYALEFFREVLGSQAGQVIEEIKGMQDHLGDLNDADVACQILREFLDEWEERQALLPIDERQSPEPIVAYLGARHAERHQLMVTFPQAWERFNRPDLRVALASAIGEL
jgi:CHAD domain-containing protein